MKTSNRRGAAPLPVWEGGAAPGKRGFTLIELLVTITVIAILVGVAIPLTRNTIQREKEFELRQALRDMRTAIDKYKEAADRGQIEVGLETEGYPPDLQILVDGVTVLNSPDGRTLKFLRRIPVDPMTNSTQWGMRSYQDDANSFSWGGQNVFDVYTTSEGIALDGTRYKDW